MVLLCQQNKAGVGIAAPQVGISKQVCYVDSERRGGILAANPKIVNHNQVKVSMKEGCLSYPGIFVKVPRWQMVVIQYTAIVLKDNWNVLDDQPTIRPVIGIESIIWQHEIDHLNGICKVGEEYYRQSSSERQAVTALFRGRQKQLLKEKEI